MFLLVWNQHVNTMCHGYICSNQNLFSHALALRQIQWLVLIIIPAQHHQYSSLLLEVWCNQQRHKNRIINNLISPLIMLVQSGKWIAWKWCQDIACLSKWAYSYSNFCGITTGRIYTNIIMSFQVRNQFVMKQMMHPCLFYCQQSRGDGSSFQVRCSGLIGESYPWQSRHCEETRQPKPHVRMWPIYYGYEPPSHSEFRSY